MTSLRREDAILSNQKKNSFKFKMATLEYEMKFTHAFKRIKESSRVSNSKHELILVVILSATSYQPRKEGPKTKPIKIRFLA